MSPELQPAPEKLSESIKSFEFTEPDTLVLYAKWFGGVKENVKSAKLVGMNASSIHIICTLKSGSRKPVKVAIEPPIEKYEELEPRLLEMKALALEGRGMSPRPQIKLFIFPPFAFPPNPPDATTAGIILAAAFYFKFAPVDSQWLPALFTPASIINSFRVGRIITALSFYVLLVAHFCESMYTLTLCWKHSIPITAGAGYVLATFIFGCPIWKSMQAQVQKARIQSVKL